MKLRHKALLIVGVTLVGLNLGLFLIASTILRHSFHQVEEERMEELVDDTITSLNQIIDQFNARFADWAAWDDTVAFAQGQKPDYVEANLNPAAINLLQVDLVAVLTVEGDLVYGSAFDAETQTDRPLPAAFRATLVPDHPLLHHTHIDSDFGGLLVLPEGILLLSSRPILNGEGEGPIQGTLIFGRYIDSPEKVRLSKTIGRPLRLSPLQSEPTLIPQTVLNQLSQAPEAIATLPLTESSIAGYALLKDVTDQPSIIVQITSPRTIHAQYHLTIKYLTGAILGLDLAVAIATMMLLERLVISRITQLNQEVSGIQISAEGGLSARVSIVGRDELAGLGGAINQMLEAIEVYERDRQQTATVLERAKFQAEAASRAKSQFLGNMSHELRTPLTAILGYSEVLALELQDLGHPALSDDVRKIERSGYHLLDMIKDMLDFSRLETDSLPLCIEPFNLLEIVQEVSQRAESWAAQNNNQLNVQCSPELGVMRSDAKRVRQCLLNVLNNACKFTQDGVITLTVDYIHPSSPRASHELLPPGSCPDGTILFAIHDTGIGIAPDQLRRVFEPFTQADETNTRRYGGTGLGLAITRRLCDALGATLAVDSQPDQGTRFTMRFPITAPSTIVEPIALTS